MELYDLFCNHPHIATDSRRIETGALFFALHGETFNGNHYAAAALDAGAAIAVIDDPHTLDSVPDAQRARYFLVPDTLTALQQLAALHRQTLGIPILAITGSNGKTTTKELIGRVLNRKFRTAVTQGNFNNHIGVPLTLLAMDRTVELGVVEMGASHCGEIAQLCAIAQPDFGLITNIGKAHLEGFGGIDGVMRGKGELLDYLSLHHGTAFYLQQNEYLTQMVCQRPTLHALPYSTTELTSCEESEFLRTTWNHRQIHTHLVGAYNLNNLAAALTVGTYFNVSPEDIVAAIEGFKPDNNRSQKRISAHNTLILDAYNANPSSMRAALENFAQEHSSQPKVVILGDMRELGSYAATEHQAIVTLLQQQHITEAYLVGEHFTQAGSSFYTTFPHADALNLYLQTHPLHDRLILIKGSRSMKLETVAEKL